MSDIEDIINEQRQASAAEDGAIVERQATTATFGRAEIDQQIATAHAFPRSVKQFVADLASLATITQEVAESCTYALPRRQYDKEKKQYVTKNIVGPSARFAELVGSCWGNARARTGLLEEGQDFVVARGVMMDLQKNWGIEVDVPRRIVGSNGQRFNVDMIGVTVSAASSIALRNAILKVVPRALWEPIWHKARATALGEGISLTEQRLKALEWFHKKGVSKETIFEHFDIKGVEDMTLEHIEALLGYKTALKDGDTTVERIFGKDDVADTGKPAAKSLDDIKAAAGAKAEDRDESGGPKADVKPGPRSTVTAGSGQPPAADLLGDSATPPGLPSFEELKEKLRKARSLETLGVHADWIRHFTDPAQKLALDEVYEARVKALAEAK